MFLNKPVFRKRLRQLVESQPQSTHIVSELCGLPSDALRMYEAGNSTPRIDSLIAIADYFDVSIDYLCGRTDDPKSHK